MKYEKWELWLVVSMLLVIVTHYIGLFELLSGINFIACMACGFKRHDREKD